MVPQSGQSSGVVLPYEQAAIRGEEMPKGLDYPDQILYVFLRDLYDRFRSRKIDKETAVMEKKTYLDDYRGYKQNWEMGNHWAQVLIKTDLARAEYKKNPTIENANRLVAVLDGMD